MAALPWREEAKVQRRQGVRKVLGDLQGGAAAMKPLIALTGYAGVGKNLAASKLEGWAQIAFADPLRAQLVTLNPLVATGLRLREAVEIHGWDACKRIYPEARRLMQTYGTEVCRGMMADSLWVDFAEKAIERAAGPCVITDLRFSNEAALVRRRRGLIIRILRPGFHGVNGHASEHQEIEADFEILNDGTPDELATNINYCAGMLPNRERAAATNAERLTTAG